MEEQYFYHNNWNINIYFEIAKELGLNIGMDYFSSSYFNRLMDRKPEITMQQVIKKYGRKKVLVFGAGPSLESNIKSLLANRILNSFITIAADGASYALKKIAGINPDFIVTDLDGYPEEEVEMSNSGSLAVVHSHGDNLSALTHYVPKLRSLIGTTQCEPHGKLYNFGGFTDGDRSVYFAMALEPEAILLAGMDFGEKVGSFSNASNKDIVRKLLKLKIGKGLLERFATHNHGRVKLYDMTSGSTIIAGFKKVSTTDLISIIK